MASHIWIRGSSLCHHVETKTRSQKMSCILRLGTRCSLGPKSEASCKEKTEGQGRQTDPAEEAASELCPMRQPDIIRGCDGPLSSLTTPRTGHTQTSFPSLCSDGGVGRQGDRTHAGLSTPSPRMSLDLFPRAQLPHTQSNP